VLIMIILGGIGNIWGVIVGAIALQYVDKTLLPFLGQNVPAGIPNPQQYNFLIFGIVLLLMMRFRPQGFLPSRQREAEFAIVNVDAADAVAAPPVDEETGQIIELENLEVAPPGQSEVGPDARAPETPGESRQL
jgi:hypothetical protein